MLLVAPLTVRRDAKMIVAGKKSAAAERVRGHRIALVVLAGGTVLNVLLAKAPAAIEASTHKIAALVVAHVVHYRSWM